MGDDFDERSIERDMKDLGYDAKRGAIGVLAKLQKQLIEARNILGLQIVSSLKPCYRTYRMMGTSALFSVRNKEAAKKHMMIFSKVLDALTNENAKIIEMVRKHKLEGFSSIQQIESNAAMIINEVRGDVTKFVQGINSGRWGDDEGKAIDEIESWYRHFDNNVHTLLVAHIPDMKYLIDHGSGVPKPDFDGARKRIGHAL
ncbi:TPA: hypothetical protein HA265_04160 [Candidatus Woesearchaeota archaeon]|nr:hypothetical protein [Candidatus Woesearchaeota archaeon]